MPMDPITQYRALGKTGERVSPIGLGGWHLGLPHVDEQLGFRIVRSAIDHGITFMDNSWDYNEGASEIRMGRALRDGYPGQGVPDDHDRRSLQARGDATTRRVATPPADRSDRSGPTSRSDTLRRSAPNLPRRGCERRAARSAPGRQGEIHRLHG